MQSLYTTINAYLNNITIELLTNEERVWIRGLVSGAHTSSEGEAWTRNTKEGKRKCCEFPLRERGIIEEDLLY